MSAATGAPWRSRGPPRGLMPRAARAGSPRRRPSGRRGRSARRRRRPRPSRKPRSSATARSGTDGRFTRTFSAAECAAAAARLAETARSLAALRLLRPASSSAAAAISRQQRTTVERDLRRDAWRRLPSAAERTAFSLVRVARHLHRRGERAVRGRVLVGKDEAALRETAALRVAAFDRREVRLVCGPAARERRDHRDERRGERRRDRGCAPAAGDRLCRGQAIDEAGERVVGESAAFSHAGDRSSRDRRG